MPRVLQLLGWPQFKVKRSFLGVFGLKMVQFFMFLSFFKVFWLICLRLKFLKVDEGLLRDKITRYDYFMSYMFGTTNTNTHFFL